MALPNNPSTRRVLCADDDESVRAYCRQVLTRSGFAVDEAANGREVMQRLEAGSYDAVVMDLDMPYLHGSTVLSLLEQNRPEMLRRLIVMTGLSDAALTGMYGKVGAVLRKPIDAESLAATVRSCTTAPGAPPDPVEETLRT